MLKTNPKYRKKIVIRKKLLLFTRYSLYSLNDLCVYVYRYLTMTDVYTAALLPTKPSSDDDSRFRHGFKAEASLPLTQSPPAVTHNTTRLCWIDVTLCDCHILADAVRALS